MVDMVRFTIDVTKPECEQMFVVLLSTGFKFLVVAYDAPDPKEMDKEPAVDKQE